MDLRNSTEVWYEKYRPNNLDEIILPPDMKEKIRFYLEDGGFRLPHLGLFSPTPGTGKSSLAKIIIKELDAEALFINASLDRGVDVLKTHIQRFASQAPIKEGSVKIVVMDEFDFFTTAGQRAFKGFIDEFGRNVRFIFTANHKENIDEPLLDRMEVYDFSQFKAEDIVKPIYDRLIYILDSEGVSYDRADVKAIINQEFPRVRQMIGLLGKSIYNGVLDFSRVSDITNLETLGNLIKSKRYEEALKIVYSLGNTDHIFGFYANNLDMVATGENKINAIIILSKYQTSHPNAKDKHLNVAGCVMELMKLW